MKNFTRFYFGYYYYGIQLPGAGGEA